MWREIIKKTIQINKQQDFYSKKWLFDLLAAFFFIVLSFLYNRQLWIININLLFLIVIAILSYQIYSSFERNHCDYLILLKRSRQKNIFFIAALLECAPYFIMLLLQLALFFHGKWYVTVLAAGLEFLLAVCVGVSAAYVRRWGKLIPILLFGQMIVLTWEWNEKIHLISPAAFLYNLKVPNYYSAFGIAGTIIILASAVLIAGKQPDGKKARMTVGGAALIFCIFAGSVGVMENRVNNATEQKEFSSFTQKGTILFEYKGLDKEQAECIARYMEGLFGQLDECGFSVPKKITFEKYIGGLGVKRRTRCVYDLKECSLNIVLTSNGLFNEEGEQLPWLIDQAYKIYLASSCQLENDYARDWMLLVGDYTMYRFVQETDPADRTSVMNSLEQAYEVEMDEGNRGELERKFQEALDSDELTLYDAYLVIESENPQSEDDLERVLEQIY